MYSERNENFSLMLKALKMKVIIFANSIDPDGAAHNELPHLNLYPGLPSSR